MKPAVSKTSMNTELWNLKKDSLRNDQFSVKQRIDIRPANFPIIQNVFIESMKQISYSHLNKFLIV